MIRARWQRLGLVLAAAATVGVALSTAPGVAADPKVQERARELEQLRARIEGMRKMLQATRGRQDSVQVELQQVEERVGKVTQALRKIERELRDGRKRLDTLHTRESTLQDGLVRQRQALARQVRASYAIGRQEQLKILLNQGDPATVRRALVYYDYLNRSRTSRIRAALQQLEEYRDVRASITAEQEQLEALRDHQSAQKEALERSRRERENVLAAIGSALKDQDRELQGMLRNEQELQQVLKALQQALSDIPMEFDDGKPFAKRKGELPWPASGRLVSRFGSSRAGGKLSWRGVMISASQGDDVRAVSRGRVAFANWLRGYGLLLIVDHGNGFMTLYGHNQSLYKDVGEWVQTDEVIATVGDSGGQDQAGLYFEIRRDGEPVNPVTWCQAIRGNLVGLSR